MPDKLLEMNKPAGYAKHQRRVLITIMQTRQIKLLSVCACLALAGLVYGGDANKEAAMSKQEKPRIIRRTHGDGRWFMGERAALEKAVSEYIEKAKCPQISGRIVCAISPHAGYPYSGPVAGHVFRAARDQLTAGNKPETLVIIGFTHGETFPGAAVLDGDAIRSPLAETALDVEAARIIMSGRKRLFFNERPHRREHSAENQIPFAQAAFPSARLVVILIGDHDLMTVDELLAGLNDLAKQRRILVVASTDLLHNADYELVTKTDKATLATIAALDTKTLISGWSGRHQTCCGIMAVVTAMRFAQAQGASKGTVLHYRNSGDDFPESRGQWVVGYGAVVFATDAAP